MLVCPDTWRLAQNRPITVAKHAAICSAGVSYRVSLGDLEGILWEKWFVMPNALVYTQWDKKSQIHNNTV
jgi:hypothetical protein